MIKTIDFYKKKKVFIKWCDLKNKGIDGYYWDKVHLHNFVYFEKPSVYNALNHDFQTNLSHTYLKIFVFKNNIVC